MIFEKEVLEESIFLLEKFADNERVGLSDWYYPTGMKVVGLKSADLKTVSARVKKYIKTKNPEMLVPAAIYLSHSGIFECQQLAYALINRNFKLIETMKKDQVISLGKFMDNWVSTDSFSTQIAGPAWRLGVLEDDDIIKWARSNDRWWRRNALVATVGLNLKSQGGSGDPVRTLKICNILVSDHDDMVVKAMSWALRELSKHTRETVLNFLEKNENTLASRIKREVNKKLATGRKNG